MADILIRGLEMPKRENLWLCLKTDGKVYHIKPGGLGTAHAVGTALPLPEGHGRLIDGDAFKEMCLAATKEAKPDFIRHEDWLKASAITISFCRDIDEQPTIVPAEGGTDDG